MNPTTSPSCPDPRLRFDFDPSLLPTCDGVPLPEPDDLENDPRGPMKLEFGAAYYAINGAYRQLLDARKAPSPSEQRERAALQAIECAILQRDALEDKYAPTGMLATPVLANGIIRDIQFIMPKPFPYQPSQISMCFAVTRPVCEERQPPLHKV
jgi:hypothetical protein